MFSFHFFGHENMLATHRNTLEFTRESELTKKGDCIVGVRADFDLAELKKAINGNVSLRLEMDVGGFKETVNALLNPGFDDAHEIVLRRSNFMSERTLGIRADKTAMQLDRKMVDLLKDPKTEGTVNITFKR